MSDVVDVSMESCCAYCGAESGDASEAKELHGLPPRQVLRRGLPESAPRAAQGTVQETRGRAKGRAAVHAGTGAAGGGLLPDLHIADLSAHGKSFEYVCVLREEGVPWLHLGHRKNRNDRLSLLPNARGRGQACDGA